MKRHFLHLCLLCVVCTLGPAAQSRHAGKKRLPNIIYIYADDLGYGELGCYGQQKIKTPQLDRMAKEGMRFTQHYSGAPVCAPARCMLLTGVHGGHSYIRGNYELGGFADSLEGGQMPLPPGIRTLPGLLKKAGYTSALCGKWGLGMHYGTGSPLQHGFDYYYGYLDQKQAHNHYPTHLWENDRADPLDNPLIQAHRSIDSLRATDADFAAFSGKTYAGDRITEKALGFIERNQKRPFFLYVPFTLPHLALQVPEAYSAPYVGQFAEKPYYGQKGYTPHRYPLSAYAGMIAYLDAQAGRIMEKIKALGLDEHTLIMFSSDNGATFSAGVDTRFFNSTAGLRGLKMDLYEGGIRVPFIARWPGKVPAGVVSDHVSAQYDLMATLAELCGLPLEGSDGISFLPTLLGQAKRQAPHPFLFFEYPENGGQLAVRMGDWKGVRRNVRKDRNVPWQLYRLDQDRGETNDVAALYPDIVRQMDAILQREHRDAHIKEWEFVRPKF